MWRLALFAALQMMWLATAEAQDACDAVAVASLPLVERAARTDTNSTLVILLTGDGGWANADERVADGLLTRGAAVIGLNMRSYLSRGRTPEVVARDVGCVAREYLTRWKRERLMLLGYSRGADIAPFVASRLSADLRDRLNMVALVSLSTHANFKFHLIDLIRDVTRPDDLPVEPELERLRGLQVLCIYGSEDKGSGCLTADSTIVTRYARDGGHRITGGFDVMAEVLERGLHPPAPVLRPRDLTLGAAGDISCRASASMVISPGPSPRDYSAETAGDQRGDVREDPR